MLIKSKLILILCLLVLSFGCKKEDSETAGSADANQVKEEVTEALEVTGAYLDKEKDAIMAKANDTYDQLKNDTQQLISDIKESGKANWQELSSGLDKKLASAQQKLSELKEAGKENLQKSSDAFNTAVDELKDAYQKTKAEFEKSEQNTN